MTQTIPPISLTLPFLKYTLHLTFKKSPSTLLQIYPSSDLQEEPLYPLSNLQEGALKIYLVTKHPVRSKMALTSTIEKLVLVPVKSTIEANFT